MQRSTGDLLDSSPVFQTVEIESRLVPTIGYTSWNSVCLSIDGIDALYAC